MPSGRIATVTLNRPERLNALSEPLVAELVAALTGLDDDEAVRCIVLTGSEKAFAAGADIGELANASAIDMLETRRRDRWADIRAVRTPARRRGLGLLPRRRLRTRDVLRPDRRLGDGAVRAARDRARPSARRRRHAAAHARGRQGAGDGRDPLGPSPDGAGGAGRGTGRAGRPGETWLEEAQALAAEIAARGPIANRLAKEAVNRAYEGPLSLGLDYERRLLALALASEDAREGLNAFLEKRPPAFQGR